MNGRQPEDDLAYPYFDDEEEFPETEFEILEDLTPEEMDDLVNKSRERIRETKELPSLVWLARELKLFRAKEESALVQALDSVRNNEGYRVIRVPKKDGQEREISVPIKPLKKVQRRINKYLLDGLLVSKNASGFSGGSIQEAIKPHLKAKSVLCVDFRDAFPSVSRDTIFNYLTEGRAYSLRYSEVYGVPYRRFNKVENYGYLSWYAARIIADLTTYNGKLPQGAPTSPRLFDLVCRELDERLAKLAANVKGSYTRYADNIFFSVGQESFPRKIRQAILKMIEGEGRSGYRRKHKHWRPEPHFQWHKLKVRRINGNEAVRMLGLNVIGGKAHNTREFKRRLRLSVHHVNWLLDHGLDTEAAWERLQGQMNFAITDTLPPKLMEAYLKLQEKIK